MIVVGVKAYTDDVNFSVVLNGPFEPVFNFTDIATNTANIYDLPLDRTR